MEQRCDAPKQGLDKRDRGEGKMNGYADKISQSVKVNKPLAEKLLRQCNKSLSAAGWRERL
jgi:hypothetical protein